jgi:hypothetical protein
VGPQADEGGLQVEAPSGELQAVRAALHDEDDSLRSSFAPRGARAWLVSTCAPATKMDYLEGALGALPLVVAVEAPPAMALGEGRDASEHQSMRDIERDKLRLCGRLFAPGLGSYPLVVKWLAGEVRARVAAFGLPGVGAGEGEGEGAYEDLARAVLRAVNRTNSGGVAYDCINQRFHVEGVTTVVPDSKRGEAGRQSV